ncbi:polysaccharide biosynthesis/export family protein [Hyphomicrobium sp. 99]|uniref:polysaccharide biosynthesis/export family protein n=1 Tax=Hyphomicrobium sp. 99 TaxID=1163419 RepID=UPI0005F76CDF|nr:polysaccharide biosynthesis/export family protein [Hyphomicrobium sp. 99]
MFGKSRTIGGRFGTSALTLGMLAFAGVGIGIPAAITHADTRQETYRQVNSPTLSEYRLNVRDRLRIQVIEWRPSRDEVYTWTAINQVYTVDPAGKISLPLAGEVAAAGFTTAELEQVISRQLAKRLNLATLPDTTIEVTDFRPIYVTGAVEKSGEYSYTGGMSVLQGVSLAGGIFRNSAAGGLRLEREWVTTAGNYQSLARERQRLLAHKARIDAELASADFIAFPQELQSVSGRTAIEYTASVMSKEQSVFDLRRNANNTQVVALNQLQKSLESEVDSLTKRIASQQTQIDLLKSELGGIKALSDKGLATQPRLLGLQRNLAELEGQKLTIESNRTRVEQEVNRTKLSKIEYENKRANDLTVELQTTEARLQQIVQEATIDERLLAETRTQAVASPLRLAVSTSDSNSANGGRPALHYTIARQIGADTIEIEATEKTLLQPGDTVKVEMTMPATEANDELDALFEGMPASKPATPILDDDTFRRSTPAPTHASIEVSTTPTLRP